MGKEAKVSSVKKGLTTKNISNLKGFETSSIGEIKVTYKPSKLSTIPIGSASDAANIFSEIWSEKIDWVEHVFLLPLNTANKPIGFIKLFEGGLSASVIDTRIVFGILLITQASGFIIAHNHPSGNLKPSDADKNITHALYTQGNLMKIPLLDHIIITSNGYFSFAEHDLLY